MEVPFQSLQADGYQVHALSNIFNQNMDEWRPFNPDFYLNWKSKRRTALFSWDLFKTATGNLFFPVKSQLLSMFVKNGIVQVVSLSPHVTVSLCGDPFWSLWSHISCKQQITDEGLITICRGCHRLQSLCVSGCANITDAILHALGQNCPRLR